MKNKAILLISGALWFSCGVTSPENPQQKIEAGDAIIGLASAVKLNPDSTHIFLGDYFENYADIDSISFRDSVSYSYTRGDSGVNVTRFFGNSPLTDFSVKYNGKVYHIPVFRSDKLSYNFTYKSPQGNPKAIALKANFNGWNAAATPLENKDGVWSTDLVLEPGLYEYLIVADGKEMLDPNNPDKKDNGQGGFNSTFRVGSEANVPVISTISFSNDSITIHYPASLRDPFIYWQNQILDSQWYQRIGDQLTLAVPDASAKMKRSDIRIFGSDENRRTNDLLIPLEDGKPLMDPSHLPRNDKHSLTMYFMMVDRFVDADTTDDFPVKDPEILPPANYYGGDIQGVTSKITNGYLSRLGMNTVWLSPIVQNPLGAYGLWNKGGVKSKFSGYHGYWPISSSKVDFRFGDKSTLKHLIDEAHSNEMNVILDYVANHVHEEHPVYKEHPDWATPLYLPDGTMNTEKWDEYRLTTWFDTFMPTLNFGRRDVRDAMTDSALFWFENYDIDGFRHDATKHIPLEFWRELTRKLKYRVIVPEDRKIYQIGETYGNPQLIDSYIGSGLLDAQFDFNLYDAAVAAFAKNEGSFPNLKRVLSQSLSVYGNHNLMGNISGNQDRTRFISYADGSVSFAEDPKLAGWTRKIEIEDTIGYNRLAMLHAFNFTIPGVPVIYYGDEIGMPGANDPDNRRMMRFGDDLKPREKEMLDEVSQIANLRKSHIVLLYGDLQFLESTDQTLVYLRNYFDKTAIVFFNSSRSEKTIEVEIPETINIEDLKSNFGNKFDLNGRKLKLILPPVSFEIITN